MHAYSFWNKINTDADALTYINALEAAGATLSPGNKAAINALFVNGKISGWYQEMIAFYPFLGTTALTQRINAKNPSTFQLTFVTTTHSANGVQFTSSTSCAKTGIIPSVHLLANSASLGVYSRTSSTGTIVDIGCYSNISSQLFEFAFRNTSTVVARAYDNTSSVINTTPGTFSDTYGLLSISRTSSTSFKAYKRGVEVASNSNANVGTRPTIQIYIGARNNSGTTEFSAMRQLAFAFVGNGLTPAQVASMNNDVQSLQAHFGRAV